MYMACVPSPALFETLSWCSAGPWARQSLTLSIPFPSCLEHRRLGLTAFRTHLQTIRHLCHPQTKPTQKACKHVSPATSAQTLYWISEKASQGTTFTNKLMFTLNICYQAADELFARNQVDVSVFIHFSGISLWNLEIPATLASAFGAHALASLLKSFQHQRIPAGKYNRIEK